jgi:Sec-independent protein translocase protein TatA
MNMFEENKQCTNGENVSSETLYVLSLWTYIPEEKNNSDMSILSVYSNFKDAVKDARKHAKQIKQENKHEKMYIRENGDKNTLTICVTLHKDDDDDVIRYIEDNSDGIRYVFEIHQVENCIVPKTQTLYVVSNWIYIPSEADDSNLTIESVYCDFKDAVKDARKYAKTIMNEEDNKHMTSKEETTDNTCTICITSHKNDDDTTCYIDEYNIDDNRYVVEVRKVNYFV